MRVTKRNGELEPVSFDKILKRIQDQAHDLSRVNVALLTQKVIKGLYDGVKTSELDTLAAETAEYMSSLEPQYSQLASRLAVSNLHKETKESFRETMEQVGFCWPYIVDHEEVIQQQLDYARDFSYSYFGLKTLCRSYLLRKDGRIVERPQHMLMRVSLGIWKDDLERAFETYHLMSNKMFTHASPTLFNSGTHLPQMSSCFLLDMTDDSIRGIYETLARCADISKSAGGIGLHVHKIRASGTEIRGTNGTSNGLVPMLQVYNATARYVDQCFAGDTLVYTSRGPTLMSQLEPGEHILTASGTLETIEKVLKYDYNGQIYRFHIQDATKDVQVTGQHQILTLANRDEYKPTVVLTRLHKGYAKPEMMDADQLQAGDYVCFPVSQVDMDEYLTECTNYSQIMVHNGIMYHRIDSITKEPYQGPVYDLEVANEHTYVVSSLGAVHNGGGKRKGAFAIYLEPWHADIFQVLQLKKNTGADELRARDLFYAMWVPDLFMKRVEEEGMWSLMCPKECPGLFDAYGDAFQTLYEDYERQGKYKRQVPAQELWFAICESQIETGGPYMLYKDSCNLKNNQANLGTLYGSNLCVAPYTRILTKDGDIVIESLKDQQVTIWNGFEWSEVTVRKTGENKSLLRVTCSNGSVLDCTPEHKFYCQKSDQGQVYQKDAKQLVTGEHLMSYTVPNKPNETQNTFIVSVQPIQGFHDTYCFTEPKRGLGTFEGIVTGQCSEILEKTSPDEVAVCNLASVALPMHFKSDGSFDFEQLIETVKVITRNLNHIIDVNYYPVEQAKSSNFKHRPIGIGVQGLQDVFFKLRLPFDSPEARAVNRDIFETIYYAACDASCELAMVNGPYESYHGSPMSQGKFQFDLWGVTPQKYDWEPLRTKIRKYGLRNSLLVALMPTASTAQILGNTECFEPQMSNIFSRSVLAGSFTVINHYLLEDLQRLGMWSETMKNRLITDNGSIQNMLDIPKDLRDLYKTVWEVSNRVIIDMAADRAPYVDQTQSMNLFMAKPTFESLSSMHFYAWCKGLKTGQYYLKTQSAKDPKKFTVKTDQPLKKSFGVMNYEKEPEGPVCTREEGCLSCGS